MPQQLLNNMQASPKMHPDMQLIILYQNVDNGIGVLSGGEKLNSFFEGFSLSFLAARNTPSAWKH